jgi:hypothetical protein
MLGRDGAPDSPRWRGREQLGVGGPPGAGAIQQYIGVDLGQLAADPVNPVGVEPLSQEHGGTGVSDRVDPLLRVVTVVERHWHHAGFEGAGVDHRPLQAVLCEHRQPVAVTQSERGQRVGEPVGLLIDLVVGQDPLTVAEALPRRRSMCPVLHIVMNQHVGSNDSLLISIGVRPRYSDNDLSPVMRTFGTFDH